MDKTHQSIRVHVGDEPIDASRLIDEVSRPDAGATVMFLGTVRDHSKTKTGVTHLDYEVYEGQVESKIADLIEVASQKWPILNAAVEHRSGKVDVQEISVAVVVSCSHRGDAFAAAEFIIDELKKTAPIWKKEFWPGGSEWSKGS